MVSTLDILKKEKDLVDEINLLGGSSAAEINRNPAGLKDPTLKYDDPWQ